MFYHSVIHSLGFFILALLYYISFNYIIINIITVIVIIIIIIVIIIIIIIIIVIIIIIIITYDIELMWQKTIKSTLISLCSHHHGPPSLGQHFVLGKET